VSNKDEYGSNCKYTVLSNTNPTIRVSSNRRCVFTGQKPSGDALAAASEPRGIGIWCALSVGGRVLGFDRKLAAVWHLPF
jgi:hypothetical protein